MFCGKCGSHIGSYTRCPYCGFVNPNVNHNGYKKACTEIKVIVYAIGVTAFAVLIVLIAVFDAGYKSDSNYPLKKDGIETIKTETVLSNRKEENITNDTTKNTVNYYENTDITTVTTEMKTRSNNETEVYVQAKDDRVPDFTPTAADQYVEKEFNWTNHYIFDENIGEYIEVSVITSMNLNRTMYDYYKGLKRYYDFEDYTRYVNDKNNYEIAKGIADSFKKDGEEKGYSQYEIVMSAVCFVQEAITYETDENSRGVREYPKYVIETLMDGCGDCEDTTILLASLIKALGYGEIFIVYDGHIALGILGNDNVTGSYYEYNGKKYFYIETTNTGWKIGSIPEQYQNMSAKVYFVN